MKIICSPEFIENPVVSIVIPSYNRAETVGQTIESIISQICDFKYEIIIGDDCSTDNARDVLISFQKKYPNLIKLLFHEQNMGLGANWATCIKECKGNYICNCDNDDYWHNPYKLQIQVRFMEGNPKYGLTHTDYRTHNRDNDKIEEHICSNKSPNDKNQTEAVMRGHFNCCNATVMYRTSTLFQYVDIDDYIKYRFTLQDWNTWMLLSKYTQFCEINISTATFGIETHSITRPQNIDNLERRLAKEMECYKYVCEKFPEDFKYEEKDYIEYSLTILLNESYKRNNYTRAKVYARKINKKSIKVICAKNLFLFKLLVTAKKIKTKYVFNNCSII